MMLTVALCLIALAALAVSAAYLWWLLRAVPLASRIVNLLLPASQILCVAYGLNMVGVYETGAFSGAVTALVGLACAVCNPLLYRSVLRAEQVETERERTRFLEERVAAQRHHLRTARRAEEEAADIHTRLDAQLVQLEGALGAQDGAAARARLADAEGVVRAPGARLCQHPAADALLRDKVRQCGELGIELELDARIPLDLPTPAVELCAVLANALDNAMDACAVLPEGDRRCALNAYTAHGCMVVEVENTCLRAGGRRGRRGGAGELPERGWGLSIIEGVCRRHGGELAYHQDGGTFKLSAIWKL